MIQENSFPAETAIQVETVCFLLFISNGKLAIKCEHSEHFGYIIKPLSLKSQGENEETLFKNTVKQYFGNMDTVKVELTKKTFMIDGITFICFEVRNSKFHEIGGNVSFVDLKKLKGLQEGEKIHVNGKSGEYALTPAFIKALQFI